MESIRAPVQFAHVASMRSDKVLAVSCTKKKQLIFRLASSELRRISIVALPSLPFASVPHSYLATLKTGTLVCVLIDPRFITGMLQLNGALPKQALIEPITPINTI